MERREAAKISERRENAAKRAGLVEELFGPKLGGAAGWEAVAEEVVTNPSPITRRIAFGKLLASMTPENALAIRERLGDLGLDDDELRDFSYAWGAIAGREAFDFASQSEEEDLSATLSGWAAADPSSALAMVENLPAEYADQRESLERSLIIGIADRDLPLATDLAQKLGADRERHGGNLMRMVAHEVIRSQGPEAAARWAENLPAGRIKGAAMDRVAGSFARENPESAAAWIETFAEQDFASGAVAEVSETWGRKDPEASVAWLEQLDGGAGQSSGFQEVLDDWEDSNPQAAANYLAQMAKSPQRDAAISGFAKGYAWQDPQTASAWAQDISDPALRERSLADVARAYFRRDPQGAMEWLPRSGLSPEAQQRALARLRR
jgi:hypothetical protein